MSKKRKGALQAVSLYKLMQFRHRLYAECDKDGYVSFIQNLIVF